MHKQTIIQKIKHYFKYKFMSGHISIGKLTIYGRNAMQWGCTLYTKKYGYICWRLPFTYNGKWFPLYLYFSPNATPWAATFMIGKKHDIDAWTLSRIRYRCLGHNFDVHGWNEEYQMENYHILRAINNSVGTHTCSYYNYAKEHGYDKEDN